MAALIKGKQLDTSTITSREAKLTDGSISDVDAGDTASDGTSTGLARRDHQHGVSTAAASGLTADTSSAEGSATSLARSDHGHAIDTTNGTISTVNAGDTSSEGSGTGVARRDHEHAVATASAVELAEANAEGSSTSLARADHTHDHGDRSGGSLHADVVAGGADGFMTGADKTKLDGIAADSAALTSTAPVNVTKAAAAVGVATDAARADHKHDVTTATASSVSTANAEGTATSLARSDHTHAHGSHSSGTDHAAAIAAGASGFLTGADKTKLDGIEALADVTDFTNVAAALAAASANIDVNDVRITDLADPVNPQDAATRKYVLDSVTGGVVYQGVWNANTNVPALASGVGTKGYYYKVNVAGTTTLDGISDWGIGDWAIFNGATWDKVDNTETVSSVNTQTGAVVLDTDDIDEGSSNLYYTEARVNANTNVAANTDDRHEHLQETLATQAITGADTALTAALAHTPQDAASVLVFLNGIQQEQGATKDYTISAKVITWLANSGSAVDMETSDSLVVSYAWGVDPD